MRTTVITITCDRCRAELAGPKSIAATVTVSAPDEDHVFGGMRFDICKPCMPLLGEFLGLNPKGERK